MPVIQFSNPARDLAKVTQYSLKVLQDIMSVSGVPRVIITSTARTPAEQARIMFENIERHGIDHQKRLYGNYGDRVIDHYLILKQSGKNRSEIITGMTAKIYQLGPGKVSRHVGDPLKLNVVDIAPSSIEVPRRAVFEDAIKNEARVSRFLLPPGDPAYHLEIPQPQQGADS